MYIETNSLNDAGFHPVATKQIAEKNGAKAKLAIPLAYAFAIGTMGQATAHFFEQRSATASWGINYAHPASPQIDRILLRTPAEDLARIREVLKPTILELASLFGVSRQAVYDWQAGAQPSPETATRLRELVRAADVFSEADIAVTSQVMRRKVAGGGTILDAVLAGKNAVKVAQTFLQTLKREATQRTQLSQQLAGRKHPTVSVEKYGAPSLIEES